MAAIKLAADAAVEIVAVDGDDDVEDVDVAADCLL